MKKLTSDLADCFIDQRGSLKFCEMKPIGSVTDNTGNYVLQITGINLISLYQLTYTFR